MNAVIYARYSSERQTEQSIEGQLRACREFAEAEGIDIIGEYIDRAISGTTDNRPQFQQMISDSSSRTFQAVIVYKLDRFARNRYDSAVHKATLKKHGVKVLSAKEHITDSPEGIIMEGLLESMNEYYSAELSQKIKRGMRENAIKGKATGGNVALGYRVGKDKRLEIDETGAAIVRIIFSKYLQGMTFAQICQHLNAAGYLTSRGKEYRGSTIQSILYNRRYTGIYTVKGVDEVSECPQIISVDVFEAAQKRLADHATRHRHHADTHDYLLTGKLLCGCREARMRGVAGTSKTKKRYYYYECKNGCSGRVRAAELEDTVVNSVLEYLTDDLCDRIAEEAYRVYQEEKDNDTEMKAARAELELVSKQLENGIAAVISGINSDTLRAAIEKLEGRKKALESEVRRLSLKTPDLKPEHFKLFMKKFKDVSKSESDKQRTIETIINSVFYKKDGILVVLNVTDNGKTPPLAAIKTALRKGSSKEGYGGGKCILYEHHFMYGYIIE